LGKRLLVTGGAGFIGSHISEYFIDRGWSADVLDDLSNGKRDQVPATAGFHQLDVRSPEAARLVREGAYNCIVHLAAQMDVRKSVADPLFDAGVNILGTVNLLEALRSVPPERRGRFVFASTGGALYGDFVTPPNHEAFPKDPESPYAISKLGAEFYLAYFGRVHGFETVALRFGNVYGPRQDPHGEAGVVAIFCGRILEGRPLTVFGTGMQTRDYVYVRDVAAAAFLGATGTLPAAGRLDDRGFNIGTGVATSVNELVRVLQQVTGSRVAVEHAPPRVGEQQHSFLDVTKARETLGWRAETDLATGLAESFRWFEARHLAEAARS
jgi:UDP-glucose 4-epimerase